LIINVLQYKFGSHKKSYRMKKLLLFVLSITLFAASCKSSKSTQSSDKKGMNKTQKGALIGAGAGAVVGGLIGSKSKNTALGAILGATIGGAAGAVIGNQMDKQAKKIEKDLGKAAKVERVGEGIKITFDSKLLFDFGKTDLQETNKMNLRKLSESLKQYPDTELLIEGHTDNVGSDSFNQNLSQNRAASVANYLNSVGVSMARLRPEGRGEAQPIATNDNDNGRQQNRRVEIAVYANDKMKTDAQKQAGN
jgi:outer membrane protein OmpA-like peptidoglycan-associated protein